MSVATDKIYSTYKTYLMHGTGTDSITYSKLVDIRDYPSLGGQPDLIDMTTLSHKSKIGVPGIQNNDAMTFTANYNPTNYSTLEALEDGSVHHFAVYFGGTESNGTVTPDGSDGKFTFDGLLSVWVEGAGVNEGRTMTVSITPTSEIKFTAPA